MNTASFNLGEAQSDTAGCSGPDAVGSIQVPSSDSRGRVPASDVR